MNVNYLINHLAISAILVIVYIALYRWQPAFTKNRVILLLTMFLSLLLPALSFDVIPVELDISNVQGVITGQSSATVSESETDIGALSLIYMCGMSIYLLWFVGTLWSVRRKLASLKFDKNRDGIMVAVQAGGKDYTFHNHMVLASDNPFVYAHEKVHIMRKHTIDVLIMHLLTALAWYNPLYYLIQYFIKENHEFQADHESRITMAMSTYDYGQFLLGVICQNKSHSLVHSYQNFIKNRIQFLSQSKSYHKMKYLMTIPIFCLLAFSFTAKKYHVLPEEFFGSQQDTLIDSITVVDTIVEFNADTYVEKVTVVKSKKSLTEMVSEIPTTGKLYQHIDTTTIFNYDNYKEQIEIEEYVIPIEYKGVFNMLEDDQRKEFAKKYGKYHFKEILPED